MKILLPTDCGNAPRIGIVSDFVASWAQNDSDAVESWLADSASWTIVGGETHNRSGAVAQASPPFSPERLELTAVITHGRFAACDGFLETGDRRLNFSHMFRFASTSKTAKIAEIRSYFIDSGLLRS